jgi:hypothetical protein
MIFKERPMRMHRLNLVGLALAFCVTILMLGNLGEKYLWQDEASKSTQSSSLVLLERLEEPQP